ncbi:MAG TPA: ribonuclease III [Polyangiaceae bacterium]
MTQRDTPPALTAQLAELFGLAPDAPHLQQAVTHPSYANERREADDNQRLEFLGDAVLGFCVSDLIYRRFADADEGTLTRLRAQLVNAEALADWARTVGVQDALRLGRGAGASGLRQSTNVLADAVEALIAACFLDAGLERAREVCERIVSHRMEAFEAVGARDAKSELQERLQAQGQVPPHYELVESGGPAHERWFRVRVRIGERILGEGIGRSKRAAERGAAQAALDGPFSAAALGAPPLDEERSRP